MTQRETVFRLIRLKSCALTFSGTDFVCRKTCVKNPSGLLKKSTLAWFGFGLIFCGGLGL
jgi:hypothetical protein